MSNINNAAVNAEITDALLDGLVEEGQEKFEYLVDKEPSAKHEFYSAMITALTGVEVTPKQYQVMISTHRYIQASDLNRAREDYRPRTAESVVKASETLLERASEMLTTSDGAVISKSSTHIPEGVVAAVNAQLEEAAASRRAKAAELAAQADAAQAVAAEVLSAEDQVPAEDVFASGGDVVESEAEVTKDDLILVVLDAEEPEDMIRREKQLKRKTFAQLQELVEELASAK